MKGNRGKGGRGGDNWNGGPATGGASSQFRPPPARAPSRGRPAPGAETGRRSGPRGLGACAGGWGLDPTAFRRSTSATPRARRPTGRRLGAGPRGDARRWPGAVLSGVEACRSCSCLAEQSRAIDIYSAKRPCTCVFSTLPTRFVALGFCPVFPQAGSSRPHCLFRTPPHLSLGASRVARQVCLRT